MTRSRASKRCDRSASVVLGLVLSSTACAGTAAIPVASSAPDDLVGARYAADGGAPPRRPDGVVLEPPPAMPPPSGVAPARGVVTLREPVNDDAVVGLVQTLIDAWQRESLESLLGLLTPDAQNLEVHGHGGTSLQDGWRARLQTHEYRRLAGIELVRPARIRRWDYDDLGVKGAPPRPPEMRPGDLLVRVPVEVTHVAGEKLFGDLMTLVLRPDGAKLRVAAYGESDL